MELEIPPYLCRQNRATCKNNVNQESGTRLPCVHCHVPWQAEKHHWEKRRAAQHPFLVISASAAIPSSSIYCYSQLIIALLWFEFGRKVPSSHFFPIFLFWFLVWQWILATYSVNWANISIQLYYSEDSIWNHCYYVHIISCWSLCFRCSWFTVTRRKNFRKLDLCF